MIRNLLRMELEPFIVGVGQVTAEDTPEGTLVVLVDYRENILVHTGISAAIGAKTRPSSSVTKGRAAN